MILGLDIGGANTKVASSDGHFAESVYWPLWKHAPLEEVLSRFGDLNPEAVAVVMTGELADCFASKSEGIKSIMSVVLREFKCPVNFWGYAGFHWSDPIELAGANWSASAALLSKEIGNCLFIDMGSTTTDLIPIREKPLARWKDYLRLANGELIYFGMLRTSLGALLSMARIRGDKVPLSPELFAIMADVYLILGELSADRYACDTPDGTGKSRDEALRRLARAVCADLEEIGEAGAIAIAKQASDHQLMMLVNAIEKQTKKHTLSMVVGAGIGERIIERAASFLGLDCILLSDKYGRSLSDIFPAYAVAKQLELYLNLQNGQ